MNVYVCGILLQFEKCVLSIERILTICTCDCLNLIDNRANSCNLIAQMVFLVVNLLQPWMFKLRISVENLLNNLYEMNQQWILL